MPPLCEFHSQLPLSGGFGAEHALEARAGELHADDVFAGSGGLSDVHYAALRGEVGFIAARSSVAEWNADFEIRADGHVEARDERSAAAAKIFARSIFFKCKATTIAAANF